MDAADRLSTGEKIAGISAVLLFIFMFFDWFGVGGDVGNAINSFGIDTSINAWGAFDFIDLFLFLTTVVTVGAVVAIAVDAEVDFPLVSVVAVLGAISFLLVLFRIIDPPGDLDRKFGVFLGLLSTAGIAYGGYRAMREEGTTFGDAADRLGGGPGAGPGAGAGGPGSGGTAPPPPPSSTPPPPPPPPPPSGV